MHTVPDKVDKLDHVPIMTSVSAIGRMFRPVVVYPGRELQYRNINCNYRMPLDCIPPFYFFQRDIAGVDSNILML